MFRSHVLVLACLALSVAVSVAGAQTAPDSTTSDTLLARPDTVYIRKPPPDTVLLQTAPPAVLPPAPVARPVLETPIILPVRAEADVRRESETAKSAGAGAQADLREALSNAAVAKGRVEVKRKEIDTTKARAKSAKTEGRKDDKIDSDAERKHQELELKVLERSQDVAEAGVARARAVADAATSTDRACSLELDLARKRADLGRGSAALDEGSKSVKQFRDLERRTLEAMRDAADKREKAAKLEQALAERRLSLQQAWLELRAS